MHSSLSRRVSEGLARAAAMTDKKGATPVPPAIRSTGGGVSGSRGGGVSGSRGGGGGEWWIERVCEY